MSIDNAAIRKPLIFVFPIFLAVGGVERNTAEVIARLKDSYDFVVITFERLHHGHGSLHHQFYESCLGVYDLAEIGDQSEFPSYLERLKAEYDPALVWICNGCPWLAANTQLIRSIFNQGVAIVDQQVYDTELGWVDLYRRRDAGLLSFDRFIAINSKIRDLFVGGVGIAPAKVDLIYPVLSFEKRAAALLPSRSDLYRKFGLAPELRYFASVGRLAPQKAPLAFLRMIEAIRPDLDPSIRFVMIGSGELDAEVDQLIAEFGLAEYVRRFPYVENPIEICRLLDGIIFTSLFEGLPIALLEALSVGTPGISTDVGDVALVFNRFGNGMIFDGIGDVAQYRRNFMQFLANHGAYKAAAVKAQDEITFTFSLANIERQYRDCFESAIASRRTPPGL